MPSSISSLPRWVLEAAAQEAWEQTQTAPNGPTWAQTARPEQLEPAGDWYCWLIRSGRGWGKTRTGAEWVLQRVRQGYKRIALVAQTKADARDTMIELGESSLLKVAPAGLRPVYEPSKRRLTWAGGAVATVFSGDEPDQLRGPQHDTAWVDELAKFKYPRDTWDNLLFGLRVGKCPRVLVTTTPRPLKLLRDIIARPTTIDVRRSSRDNFDNLSDVYRREVIEPLAGTRLGRQEIDGEILEDTPGALWKRSWLDDKRVQAAPELARVVVAIDPAATSGDDSDETGIVVAGLGVDGRGYVLADYSRRDTPDGWARAAVRAYHAHQANLIVAETNQGGEMVTHTLRTAWPLAPISTVHASRGKATRAEPISALYEQGRVSHVGSLPELEDQLCNWVPGAASPDRLDALVWALTHLRIGQPAGAVDNPFYS